MVLLPFWIANCDKKNNYVELLPRHFTVWQLGSHSESGHLDKDLSLRTDSWSMFPLCFSQGHPFK